MEKFSIPCHASPDKPDPKRTWLVREIPNSKSQIPNNGVSFGPILLRQKIIAAISGYLECSLGDVFQDATKKFLQKKQEVAKLYHKGVFIAAIHDCARAFTLRRMKTNTNELAQHIGPPCHGVRSI